MKNDLLKFCRYYKGEDECPFVENNAAFAWDTERVWLFESSKEKREASNMDMEILSTYINAGLGEFNSDDGIPITLKALLFFRLTDYFVTAESFKEMYLKLYPKKERD